MGQVDAVGEQGGATAETLAWSRSLDSVREWITFPDPADPDHEIRADATWLMSSWTCLFGNGCPGIERGRPDDGCCTHGAFFSGAEDEKRVRAAAAELTEADWQFKGVRKSMTEWDEAHGERRKRTRRHEGACVFLNRPGFPAGQGCSLHALALRTGRPITETKPDVCWQLPLLSEEAQITRTDGRRIRTTTVTEFDRRGWGSGGQDLQWYCTEASEAHTGKQPVYRSSADEITALIGVGAYATLVELLDARARTRGLLAIHPAEPLQGAAQRARNGRP